MKGHKLEVVGGDERIEGVSKVVQDGEEFKVGNLTVKSLHTPCHTSGHICYYVTTPKNDSSVVFTGDYFKGSFLSKFIQNISTFIFL